MNLDALDNKNLNAIMVHPKHYEVIMRFEDPTKWELFLDGFHNFWYAWDSYDTIEHFPQDFWESLSNGWMQMEIYDYDDPFNPSVLSKQRKMLYGIYE